MVYLEEGLFKPAFEHIGWSGVVMEFIADFDDPLFKRHALMPKFR